jgi:hypothetical protein
MPAVIVVGSQSILGTYREDRLPAEATRSAEIDSRSRTATTKPPRGHHRRSRGRTRSGMVRMTSDSARDYAPKLRQTQRDGLGFSWRSSGRYSPRGQTCRQCGTTIHTPGRAAGSRRCAAGGAKGSGADGSRRTSTVLRRCSTPLCVRTRGEASAQAAGLGVSGRRPPAAGGGRLPSSSRP